MTQTLEDMDQEGGPKSLFFCKVCNVNLKDSQAYIDHINSKNHYKAMGMSMVVERVGVDRVKERLAGLKRKKDQAKMLESGLVTSHSKDQQAGIETIEQIEKRLD